MSAKSEAERNCINIAWEASKGCPRGRNGKPHVDIWACWHCNRSRRRSEPGFWQIISTDRGPKRHYVLTLHRHIAACGLDVVMKVPA